MHYTENQVFAYNWWHRKEGHTLADYLNSHGTFKEKAGELRDRLIEYANAYNERCLPSKVHAIALEDESGIRENTGLDLLETAVTLAGIPSVVGGATYAATDSIIAGALAGWVALIFAYGEGWNSRKDDIDDGLSHIDREQYNYVDKINLFLDRCYLALKKGGRELVSEIDSTIREYREKRDALRAEYLPMIAGK